MANICSRDKRICITIMTECISGAGRGIFERMEERKVRILRGGVGIRRQVAASVYDAEVMRRP